TTMLERVGHIMEQAVNKIVRHEEDIPDYNTLAARILSLGRELAQARQDARRYRELVTDLQGKLGEFAGNADAAGSEVLGKLQDWLQQAIAATETSTEDSQDIAKEALLRVIAAQVRILPSGHEFFIEGSDSILEAGLRSGLALNYGCSNGNCGLCKAKVVSGQVGKIRDFDHVLSETEKGLGYILTCSHTAVTDVVLEAEEAAGSRDIPLQEIDIRVKKIEAPDEHVVLLQARTPRTQRLRFLAGQYLSLEIPGVPPRDCAIASCPCDDMNLQFHLPTRADDPFSRQLREHVKPHDSIHIRGPRGEFTLDEVSPRSLVFIACNTGFGAVKSLVEHAMALDTAEHIYLCWVTTPGISHYAGNLCRAWEDALDNFHYTALDADAEAEVPGMLTDYLQGTGDPGQIDFYACLPESLLDATETELVAHGVPSAQLRLEPLRS
ncbi:MAG TPA: 2Fe-2S iron-sulfur cluster-binding protein, partial [Gammaproteobacteria bacterium]|nr:2Fe-2S iron-sulfur cluster-binding protein [Gammaproteobacteria bacterium]